jgi:hypothetical protein
MGVITWSGSRRPKLRLFTILVIPANGMTISASFRSCEGLERRGNRRVMRQWASEPRCSSKPSARTPTKPYNQIPMKDLGGGEPYIAEHSVIWLRLVAVPSAARSRRQMAEAP